MTLIGFEVLIELPTHTVKERFMVATLRCTREFVGYYIVKIWHELVIQDYLGELYIDDTPPVVLPTIYS